MNKKKAKNANSLLRNWYDTTGLIIDSHDKSAIRTEDIISRWNMDVIEFQAHLSFFKNLALKDFKVISTFLGINR